VITLEADPVRMWRGDLAGVLDQRATRLLGVTRWTEFLLIQGLAAETRRRVQYQRFDAATGTMVWLIA
jgi:non-homologous end joining protein Ku